MINISASFHVTGASIDRSGPGAVNIIILAPDRYEIQMAGEGIYQCTAIHPNLPGIAAAMHDIEMVDIRNNFANYRIRKDENYGGEDITAVYNVYFIKTPEGFWKIYRY